MNKKSFKWIFGLYFATFVPVNLCDTLSKVCELKYKKEIEFLSVTACNISIGITKDRAFAILFGVGKPKPMKLITYLSWFMRDGLTLGASITMPPILGSILN